MSRTVRPLLGLALCLQTLRRQTFRRLARRSLPAAVVVLLAPALAQAAAPYVVVDVSNGRVLMQEDATMPWHPASVTKLMTVYVALHQMQQGKIGWDTPIPASMRAARAAPSKIGLKPGQEVTLENATKMLLVKSANDMAVVIAEGVGGTVEAFADMMNAEAARLGMRESHFINPNGLHAEGQQTSARDLAILARALLTEFPDHADLFSIPAVQLGDRVMKNTNGLIGRYPGIEGMKTGFVCASGFNLVALASRNGQRLLAVVLGQPSAADRTIKAAALLDKGFSGSVGLFGFKGGSSLDALPRSPVSVAPNMREEICVRRKGPPASEEELDATPNVSAQADGESMYATMQVANASAGSIVRGTHGPRSLSARAPLEPIPVFLGRAPGSASAPMAANAKPIPMKPDEPTTATAYSGDKTKVLEPGATPPPLGAGPMRLVPAATIPLNKAGAGIGTGAKPSAARKLGAIETKPALPKAALGSTEVEKPKAKPAAKPAAKAPAAKAKPVAKPASVAKAGEAKPSPKAAVKPAAKPAPKAISPKATAPKPAAPDGDDG